MVVEPEHRELRVGPVLFKTELLDEPSELAIGAPRREAWLTLAARPIAQSRVSG
ncbi:hypothetical protein OHA77_09385 [Streptosporangium sp. NBC_01639]|uniref:hypothetical protein n=1 Tax=Streptosporangium sp. NBC_01639 TaxID=2975948 RepID=UPI00386D9798|nr:hypothetical protein OHA77_09385 [Streptosporangium sp. NBC_01639]